jgi:hypothetical protein
MNFPVLVKSDGGVVPPPGFIGLLSLPHPDISIEYIIRIKVMAVIFFILLFLFIID